MMSNQGKSNCGASEHSHSNLAVQRGLPEGLNGPQIGYLGYLNKARGSTAHQKTGLSRRSLGGAGGSRVMSSSFQAGSQQAPSEVSHKSLDRFSLARLGSKSKSRFNHLNKHKKNERFNEELESVTKSIKEQAASIKNLGQLRDATSRRGPGSVYSLASSRVSRPKSSSHVSVNVRNALQKQGISNSDMHKKRIMDVVEQLNEEELEKVSEMLRESEALLNQDEATVEADVADELAKTQEDEVQILEENRDDVISLVSKATTKVAYSSTSQLSNRTYISQLQNQLEKERKARQTLENQLKQLKDISTDIEAHLHK